MPAHIMNMKPILLIDRLPAPLRNRLRQVHQHAARRSFAWHVGVMLIGTVAGQAVSILLSPVLTRIFTPEQFGYLSVYGAVLMIFGVVASLGLELAIPICIDEVECANLLALCGLALTGTTGLLIAMTYLIPADLLSRLWLGPLGQYRYLLPIGFACLGGYFALLAVATRASAFKEIARTRISQGISGPVSQIVFGLAGLGTPGLVIGFVIGQCSGTLLLLTRCILPRRDWLHAISWPGILAAARRYIGFPLFASWARLLDAAGGGLVLFVLFSACYSSRIAGFMFLSERVIWRPLLLVSSSLLQVFIGEAGKAVSQDPAQLRRRFYQVVPRQMLLVTAWIVVANLLAGWAFPLLFGHEWGNAIPYLRALSVAYWVQAVLHPVSTTLQMLEHQVTAAMWQVGRLAAVVAGVILAWRHGYSALSALWIGSLAQAVCCLVLLGLMMAAVEQVARRRKTRPAPGTAPAAARTVS
jgi:O-antigen/teichoic acid export membrane protein